MLRASIAKLACKIYFNSFLHSKAVELIITGIIS